MEPILLIGANGQLGTDLSRVLPTVLPAATLVRSRRADLDVTDPAAIERILETHAPGWVINTAAFHRVDDINTNPELTRLAFTVNASAAHQLARACARRHARLLHLSTDYVFSGGCDGGPPGPYKEDAVPVPVSAYGVSKLAGEQLIRQAGLDHVIVRSCGLYGVAGSAGKGGNFVETMLRLAKEHKPIQVVNDQTLTPTYTADLAEAIARLIGVNPPGGVYHLTNSGQCSWFEFASRIFDYCKLTPHLTAVTSEQFGAPAARPRPNSALQNTRAVALGVPPLRPWPEALEAYLRAKGHLAG